MDEKVHEFVVGSRVSRNRRYPFATLIPNGPLEVLAVTVIPRRNWPNAGHPQRLTVFIDGHPEEVSGVYFTAG